MKRVVSIDVPLLTAAGCNSYQAMQRLEETEMLLQELKRHGCLLLFADALFNLICSNTQFPPTFWKTFSGINTEGYVTDGNVSKIKASPDVTTTGLGNDIETEIKSQLVNLHGQKADVDTLYVVGTNRGFTKHNQLETTLGTTRHGHDLLNVNGGAGLDAYFRQYSPRLVQLKHGQQPYVLGGNVVSPFSAYDPNDPRAAEALLARAMEDYKGEYSNGNPPDDLYTWDAENKCYVAFHHSGRWEYHGHNLQSPYTDVPQYIKEKYHIWK